MYGKAAEEARNAHDLRHQKRAQAVYVMKD